MLTVSLALCIVILSQVMAYGGSSSSSTTTTTTTTAGAASRSAPRPAASSTAMTSWTSAVEDAESLTAPVIGGDLEPPRVNHVTRSIHPHWAASGEFRGRNSAHAKSATASSTPKSVDVLDGVRDIRRDGVRDGSKPTRQYSHLNAKAFLTHEQTLGREPDDLLDDERATSRTSRLTHDVKPNGKGLKQRSHDPHAMTATTTLFPKDFDEELGWKDNLSTYDLRPTVSESEGDESISSTSSWDVATGDATVDRRMPIKNGFWPPDLHSTSALASDGFDIKDIHTEVLTPASEDVGTQDPSMTPTSSEDDIVQESSKDDLSTNTTPALEGVEDTSPTQGHNLTSTADEDQPSTKDNSLIFSSTVLPTWPNSSIPLSTLMSTLTTPNSNPTSTPMATPSSTQMRVPTSTLISPSTLTSTPNPMGNLMSTPLSTPMSTPIPTGNLMSTPLSTTTSTPIPTGNLVSTPLSTPMSTAMSTPESVSTAMSVPTSTSSWETVSDDESESSRHELEHTPTVESWTDGSSQSVNTTFQAPQNESTTTTPISGTSRAAVTTTTPPPPTTTTTATTAVRKTSFAPTTPIKGVDKLSDIFGWRKPGQKRFTAADCGCPPRGPGRHYQVTAATPDNFTAVAVFAKVFFPYRTTVFDELPLLPGDILTELQPYAKNWMRGCLRGYRGLFPSNFARVAKACPVPGQPFNFEQAPEDALGPCDPPLLPVDSPSQPPAGMASTHPADVTPYTFHVEEGFGVKLEMEAVVEFDYTAHEVDELSIHKGDVITDIRMQPGGWWEGCLHGRRGMFPDNFVKVRNKADSNSVKETMANNEVQLRASSGRRCKVLFSYQPANDDELELQVSDVIEILDEVEEGWWRGKLRNRVGVFPSNFVTEITEKQTNGGPGSRKTSSTQPPPHSMLRKEEVSVIPVEKIKGVIVSETDSPASPTGPDSGNPNALDVESNAPTLPPKPVKEICRVLYPYEAANEDELTLKEGDIITIVTKEVQDKGWWKGEIRGHVGLFPDNFVAVVLPDESPQVRKPDRPPPVKLGTTISSSKANNTAPKKNPESNAKVDEKAPPVLSKKPVLPPASKKPQLRSAASAAAPLPTATVTASKRGEIEVGNSPEQRLNDLVDGTASSKLKISNVVSGEMDFDGVERGAMLTHPTASRAKAPRRRLPTSIQSKETESAGNLINGNSELHDHSSENNTSLDEIEKENGFETSTPGSASSASSGTASNRNSKEWEKNKAPWMEELKMSQAAKKSQGIKYPPAPSPPKLDQGRVKKEIPDSPASPTSPEPSKPNAVAFRQHSTTNSTINNVASAATSVSVGSRPQSVHGEVPTSRLSGSGNRPVSMYSPTGGDKLSTPLSNSVPAGATVPMKQFMELVDKVSKLEHHCEFLTRTVSELTVQLKEEKEKRVQVQQELIKLTNLVTQV